MSFLFVILIFVGVIYVVNKLYCFWCRSKVCLVGKTALITGGCSGLGYQAAISLASKGCRVIIADIADTTKPIETIIKETHNPHIIGKKLNLASLQSVRDLAKDIIGTEPRLDILINNAGVGNFRISYSSDGLENTMQINYFGHFLLTHLLIDLLKKSAPSRIIFTSSPLAYVSNLSIANLNPKEDYGDVKNIITAGSYGASKLCQALAAKMFGKKLIGTGVTANTFSPGGCRTRIFFDKLKTWQDYLVTFIGIFVWCYGKSPEAGAQTMIYLAQADEVKDVTGKFFMEGKVFLHPLQLRDENFCDAIWERSKLYTKLEPHEIKC